MSAARPRGTLALPGAPTSLSFEVQAPPWALGPGPTPCFQADPELFFPWTYDRRCEEQIEEARSLCGTCPVRSSCLDWAVDHPDLDGLWAGTTPPERRRIRTGRAPRPPWWTALTTTTTKETA